MEVNIVSIVPFILLLLSIAAGPLINHKWWEKNYHKVSIFLSLIIITYYITLGKSPEIFHAVEEFIMFISLLASLYVVSGGILIEIKGYSTPLRNVMLLAVGAVLANFIGTTGASMLLIRPFIKTNKIRITGFHVIFFIFIVSNIGGSLTPIGDPPLFLGFLKGIPFFWLFDKMIFKWVLAICVLLIVFYILDYRSFKKQSAELIQKEKGTNEKIEIKSGLNFIFLLVIIASVFIPKPVFLREGIMLLTALISYKMTNREIHLRNHFNFFPIKEIAWLFIGIFITMMPALELLSNHSKELNITSSSQYYWYTGFLSAFLDNAPTYLTFLTASMGSNGLDVSKLSDVLSFIASNEKHIVAISVSSVFFGAMTYIGNGPNFMVKSIADSQDVEVPGFLGYIFKYSLTVLVPLYVLIWLLFIY